jgi:hypothetical protein
MQRHQLARHDALKFTVSVDLYCHVPDIFVTMFGTVQPGSFEQLV